MDDVSQLETVCLGVQVSRAKQRFSGLEVGTRMTVLTLETGRLVYSPVQTPVLRRSQEGAHWVVAPNLLHHLYVGAWVDEGYEAWAAAELPDKRADIEWAGTLTPECSPFGDEIAVSALACFPHTNEIVLLHRPSRTLLVTDLVFNFAKTAPWLTRAAMRCLCGYPGCKTTLLERFGMKRDVAREEIAEILTWDFDRLIMCHGEIIERGAKSALEQAFSWLWAKGQRALPASD